MLLVLISVTIFTLVGCSSTEDDALLSVVYDKYGRIFYLTVVGDNHEMPYSTHRNISSTEYEWYSYGYPELVPYSMDVVDAIKYFKFDSNAWTIQIDLLTSEQKKLIVEAIKAKYDVDVRMEQIKNPIFEKFQCRFDTGYLKMQGSASHLNTFPLVVEFKYPENIDLRNEMQKLLHRDGVEFECEANTSTDYGMLENKWKLSTSLYFSLLRASVEKDIQGKLTELEFYFNELGSDRRNRVSRLFNDLKLLLNFPEYDNQAAKEFGLVHHWPMSGNYLDVISGKDFYNGHNTTFSMDRHQNENSALSFKNGSMLIQGIFYFNGGLTFSLWINMHSESNTVFTFSDSINSTLRLLVNSESAIFEVSSDGIDSKLVSNEKLRLNEWAFVAVSVEGTRGRMFIDNKLAADGVLTMPHTFFSTKHGIGADFADFDIDEVKIYNRALTHEELKTDLEFRLSVNFSRSVERGLVHYWPLSNGSTVDVVGGKHLATSRFANYGNSSKNGTLYTTAPSGVYFNGDFTVTMWVRVYNFTLFARALDFGNGPYSDNIIVGLSFRTQGVPFFEIYNGWEQVKIVSNRVLELNKWTFLAATLSDEYGRLYINDLIVATGKMLTPVNDVVRKNNYFWKSNWDSDELANADMLDIKIYNRALSQKELINEMNECDEKSRISKH